MKTITIGEQAPLFSLKDENEQEINLSDYIGKKQILVYFYPKAMTPGCTVQAQALRDNKSELEALNTKVFGIIALG